jgi:hypothetical protein
MTGQMDWFRFHHSALNDPKVQRLAPELFRAWVNLLCLASQQPERGVLPVLDDCAFALRTDLDTLVGWVEQLVEAGLLDELPDDAGYMPHNWAKWQYGKPSDAPERVVERVRKHREKGCNAPVTPDVTPLKRGCNATDTDTDTETDTETEQIQSYGAQAPDKRGTRAPKRYLVTDGMVAWAERTVGYDRSRCEAEVEPFLDYHTAKGSIMKDWDAAFRTWVRNSTKYGVGGARRAPPKRGYMEQMGDRIDRAVSAVEGRSVTVVETTGVVR